MRFTTSQLFLRDIKSNFWSNYSLREASMDARLARIMARIPSDKPSEAYGYALAAPVARIWSKGAAIPSDGGTSVNFQVRNWKFGVAVELSEEDIEDDQTHAIMSRVVESAATFALLPERHFYWAFSGGTTVDALQMQPFLPLAPDGASWFSTTDGNGNNRFGVTNGNIEPSLGVGLPDNIIQTILNALARMGNFKNNQNQPYWNPQTVMRELSVVYALNNLANFTRAINQLFVVAASGNAAPSNLVIDANLKIVQIASPRLTSNNYGVCAMDADTQAPFWQERVAPVDVLAERGNSDVSREWDVQKFYVRSRGAFGLNLPVMWVGCQ